MNNRTLIHNGTLVNEGKRFEGYIVTEGKFIVKIGTEKWREKEGEPRLDDFDRVIDAAGGLILPGVIDDQVHFREPGMTWKGNIESESMAAVAGGVTSFMEMPNTRPAAVTLDLLEEKFGIAAGTSVANHSFYLGATNDNMDEITRIDPSRICGVKVFMGSSTGNMLVDDQHALSRIFAESPVPVATHCEDEAIIQHNLAQYTRLYGEDILPGMHPLIRSEEACYTSTAKAVELAHKYGTQLHVLHLSTAKELSLFEAKPLPEKRITNEVCIGHLWFSDEDYAAKGNFIKWNPAIKSKTDREALRQALDTGKADIVATDHAPHTMEEKSQPYLSAPSGGPMVQHSLVAMLELARQGIISIEKTVEKMAHTPAILFRVKQRGFLREGYFADVVIVHPDSPWTVSKANILYKCGWSPLEGVRFHAKVAYTMVNGRVVCRNGVVDASAKGEALEFDR